ncbi:MAG: DUF86 domain-containing protein [Promethearchaeia archaeon]
MFEKDIIYLKDIKNAIKSIENFVKGMNYNQFQDDDKTASAVIRKIEIIGEAVKNLSPNLKKEYSEIPWKKIAGMRDKLIHAYSNVDLKLVWSTIKKDFQAFNNNVIKILKEKNY